MLIILIGVRLDGETLAHFTCALLILVSRLLSRFFAFYEENCGLERRILQPLYHEEFPVRASGQSVPQQWFPIQPHQLGHHRDVWICAGGEYAPRGHLESFSWRTEMTFLYRLPRNLDWTLPYGPHMFKIFGGIFVRTLYADYMLTVEIPTDFPPSPPYVESYKRFNKIFLMGHFSVDIHILFM